MWELARLLGRMYTIEALVGFQGLRLTSASETRNACIRLLKNKGFKEDAGRTNRVVRHGFIHDPGIQQEPAPLAMGLSPAFSIPHKQNVHLDPPRVSATEPDVGYLTGLCVRQKHLSTGGKGR